MTHQRATITNFASSFEVSSVGPQLARPQTPLSEDRFSSSFKSLFTLADVAAKRRANEGIKTRTSNLDEMGYNGSECVSPMSLKRSKSSGDVAMFAENSRSFNANSATARNESPGTLTKGLRMRAVTTPFSTPSKIPKARSLAWLQTFNTPFRDSSSSDVVSSTSQDISTDELNVDDTVFVLITPPRTAKKVLTLAAHTPSLPQIASPFSPRTNQPCMSRSPRLRLRCSPDTGHTTASLLLTKSHWELRYETWTRSLGMKLPLTTARSAPTTPTRSRFPAPLSNPALFPRAGSLTPTALRPVLDGTTLGDDARPALEVDWALRGWPLDKIQRALFVHDMDIRIRFAQNCVYSDVSYVQNDDTELELMRTSRRRTTENIRRANQHPLRRWEWDWELRWKVIENMAQDESETAECEYDVFIAEGYTQGDDAYGGCELQGGTRMRMMRGEWEWREDVMEVDAML